MRIELDGDNQSGVIAVEDDNTYQTVAVVETLTLGLTEQERENAEYVFDG